MKSYKMTIEGKELEFVCEAADTRNGFKHTAVLYIDGRRAGAHTCYYLNRTWESYAYQTTCRAIAYEKLDAAVDDVRREWMDARGYKRLSAGRRAEWERFPAGDNERVRFWQGVLFVLNSVFPLGGSSLWYAAGAREREILQDLGNVSRTGRQCYKLENTAGDRYCLFHIGRSEYVG